MPGIVPGVAAGRVANRWDLRGPSMALTGPTAGHAALAAATMRTALVLRRSAVRPVDHEPERVGAIPPGCLVLANSHALAAALTRRCRARRYAHLGPHDTAAQLPVPALLLDAMVRTTFFTAGEPEHAHIRVLRGIARIDLPAHCSDRDLALRHPEGIELACDIATDNCTATTPSGRLVARLTGVDTPAVARIPSPPVRNPRTPR